MVKKNRKPRSRETQQSNEASNQDVDVFVDEVSEGILLSSQERGVCARISEGDTIHSQRAQALLAIDEGVTQPRAAEKTGLTKGAVRYWLGKYRSIGLGIFPESLLNKGETGLVIPQAETLEEDALSAVSTGKAGKQKGKKSKNKKGKRKTKKKKKKPRDKKRKGKKRKKNKKKSK